MSSKVDAIVEEELPENMIVIGPGQILAQARITLGLTQEQVADKLKFRVMLVKEIENNIFDESLPEAFNRGYLINYAKLVKIAKTDVLTSYEALSVAQIQCAEMQSFSKITEKQAANSRLMWVSYLIVALLIGSTAMWWMQEVNQQDINQQETSLQEISQEQGNQLLTNVEQKSLAENKTNPSIDQDNFFSEEETAVNVEHKNTVITSVNEPLVNDTLNHSSNKPTVTEVMNKPLTESLEEIEEVSDIIVDNVSTAVFTFLGDCWVNISDATGERIAWGIKKSGYVMTIKGVAPFKVTVGKPELVTILFNDQLKDLSEYPAGNIAKFSLLDE